MKNTISNYMKPTPAKWRKIGDFVLIIQAVLSANIPALPIAENKKIWAMLVVNLIGTTVKFWTNTKKEDEVA
jgi:hypothetical protein